MIEYVEINGIKGFFPCFNGMGVISSLFCAEQHRLANTKTYINEHRRTHCRFCPAGALHAGEKDNDTCSRLYKSMLCSRCQRVSSRLVHGRLCISCYNRATEQKKGKNAKGNALRLIRYYYKINLMTVKNNVIQIKIVENVMSLQEAIFSVLLTEKEQILFAESEGAKFIIHEK